MRYEDLVDAPQRGASLCTFLNLDFEAGMTALQRTTENLGDTKGAQQIVAGNYENKNANGRCRITGGRILLFRGLQLMGIPLAA